MKEILELNPNQRIIFASAHVDDMLKNSIQDLKRIFPVMQKPFQVESLLGLVENVSLFEEIEHLNKKLQNPNSSINSQKTSKQISDELNEMLESGVWFSYQNQVSPRLPKIQIK